MEEIIKMIINSLDDSLLKEEYLQIKNKNKFTGHCYVATETLYHLLSEDEQRKYKPFILNVGGTTHWFLKNIITNEIIDITKDQFDFPLDYSNSKNHFFLTKNPSKRALVLINRIYEKNSH